MKIIQELNDDVLLISLEGELNTSTAPELENLISDALKGIKTLIFDFKKLDYLSSAGLRVLLIAQKIMSNQGNMIIRHANDNILDIFNITGFTSVLTIEN